MFENLRVYLRALEPGDYRTSIKWRNDDEIWSLLLGPKYYVSEAYEKKWVEDVIFSSGDNLTLAGCLKETNEHIGYVHLKGIDAKNRNAALGILIGEKKYWNQGLGPELMLLMIYHGFYVLGLQRIEGRQLIHNKRANIAVKSLGLKHEGVLRKAVFKDGQFVDVNILSVIREDFDEILNSGKYQ